MKEQVTSAKTNMFVYVSLKFSTSSKDKGHLSQDCNYFERIKKDKLVILPSDHFTMPYNFKKFKLNTLSDLEALKVLALSRAQCRRWYRGLTSRGWLHRCFALCIIF